jgi:hypothetical protein
MYTRIYYAAGSWYAWNPADQHWHRMSHDHYYDFGRM